MINSLVSLHWAEICRPDNRLSQTTPCRQDERRERKVCMVEAIRGLIKTSKVEHQTLNTVIVSDQLVMINFNFFA
jgi:hypothetical protein